MNRRLTTELVDLQKLAGVTGWKYRLKPWESVLRVDFQDDVIAVSIKTYEVREMAREDRYNQCGERCILFKPNGRGRWEIAMDKTFWDDDFVPFVHEKVGRRDTAQEFTARRDWEMMCFRPGRGLDSYARVTDPMIPSTKRMERHY